MWKNDNYLKNRKRERKRKKEYREIHRKIYMKIYEGDSDEKKNAREVKIYINLICDYLC